MLCALALTASLGLSAEPASSSPPPPSTTAASAPSPRRRRHRYEGPPNWRFIGGHFGAGVGASLLILPATYWVADRVGHRGHGLSPVVGALLIGAFVPPVLVYTVQWGVGHAVAPKRDRYWPGFLVRQFSHLAVFATATLAGANLRHLPDAAAVVLADSLATSGLATMTAELTHRPQQPPALGTSLPRGFAFQVPIVRLRF